MTAHGEAQELEERVAEFLGLRECEPGLTPEDFARRHAELAPQLLAAIRSACAVQGLLTSSAGDAPERIGSYRVTRRLGRGGMGLVYAVERDGQPFALKLLAPELAGTPRALERFQREARVLAGLAHPGIVRVHDTGLYQGAPFLVMEHVAGPTLAELALPLAPARAARIVCALARAVAAAHAAGALHRDLKPSNVILRADDAPVLLDFGLVAAEDEATLTSSGALLGTPRYMSPEQAAGAPAEPRTDVYGLGLVLFELLVGAPARSDGSRAEVLARVRRGRVAWPRGARVPEGLRRLVDCALAHEPRRRPASAAELAAELERWLAGTCVRLRPPRADERLVDALRRRPQLVLLGVVVIGVLWLGVHLALRAAEPRAVARVDPELAARARRALEAGATDEAIAVALAAADAFRAEGGDAAAELPRLLALAEPSESMLAGLAMRVERREGGALLAFALAYGLDSAHRLAEAAAAYSRALVLDPGLLRAHLNLAHLFAGAQLGACQACERAYAEAPEMLAPGRALAHLEQALELDRGADENCVGRVVQTTLTLATRVPEVGAPERMATRLRVLLAQPELPASSRRRIEEGLARLTRAGG